jgi:L-alanine-DL-glutamate epimerase-like enolase superfamily enzyme
MQSAGAIGGATITAASGIEIALWDLAGRILETPACNLLGGRFRDRVRFYQANFRFRGELRHLDSGAQSGEPGWNYSVASFRIGDA